MQDINKEDRLSPAQIITMLGEIAETIGGEVVFQFSGTPVVELGNRRIVYFSSSDTFRLFVDREKKKDFRSYSGLIDYMLM